MRARSTLIVFTAALACSWGPQAQPAQSRPTPPVSRAVQDQPGATTPPSTTIRNGSETETIVPGDRYSQQVERIEVRDKGATIHELRVGGQTQSITVQPNAPVPSYNVQPADALGEAPARDRGPGATGPRTWKLFGF